MPVSEGIVFLGAKENVQVSEMRWVRSSFNLFEEQKEGFFFFFFLTRNRKVMCCGNSRLPLSYMEMIKSCSLKR